MIEIGSRLRLVTSLFVLLALILLGYNGSRLMALFDRQLIGPSSESRLASEKWNRLEALIEKNQERRWNRPVISLVKESLSRKFKAEEPAPAVEVKPGPVLGVEQERENPPDITGILEITDSGGKLRTAAMVGGMVVYENDKVLGFLIEEISEKGITLTKGGGSWFVEAPQVPYSIDRGD